MYDLFPSSSPVANVTGCFSTKISSLLLGSTAVYVSPKNVNSDPAPFSSTAFAFAILNAVSLVPSYL